ncbi:alpha/beta hydrolase [Streptomyces formicae]|uniref:Alpha/beta fold hydrolase n=1 Tax=Streptomyces formicae TaxID=1616117 RepID=A0ABY3WQ28_9ACTN|nr:alpha/beta hydrolase [Streptomyces formicae]UNM11918.1 alpha/beta fold hydrolase [Streptomyces formicae]
MKAPTLYGVVGSLVLSALAAAPAGGAVRTDDVGDLLTPEGRGTLVATARARAAGISFGHCPEVEKLPKYAECGTFAVPLDYAEPFGRQIRLTVSRARATGTPAERQGALVYNPGGPGGSGMYFPKVRKRPEWKRIARAYDLVGYAPRGVGRSAPLSCQDPAEFTKTPTVDAPSPSPTEKRERIARARAYAAGCARAAGPDLRHYHSLANVRDLEVLRAALREDGLSFYGVSYGTYLGALHATLFPGRVRRMVLDSVVDPSPEKIWYRSNLDQSLAFESRWQDFLTWVARHHRTYGLGTTPQAVQHSYETARARLALKPAGGRVGPGELQPAFLRAGYYDDYWTARAYALSRYLKGDPRPLIKQAAPDPEEAREEENGNAVYTAVECNDAPWPTDWAVWDRDNTALARRAPFETWANVWMNLPCAYWQGPRQRPHDVGTRPGELPPVLLLAAERDGATPYAGALELERRLAGSVLVTERDAGSHGIGAEKNACVNGHMEAYLLTGRMPVRRASCAPHPQPDPVSLDQRAVERVLPPAV